ncbi:outer membrane protein with beta-barrel domain [Pontibacter ummariensis]|uniref:Outer membrane protein beta-barrel domain-containing protein n=1 Tax=Pontibacter ummariensis TaxID=1610492 RepID=A0A239JL20_9BACT|nr:porin family protein [Pontibacter ummariensis]PRY07874.1 outer membrane protein with beta-barrel domain [Pontibacter ummariensis]SNT06581.1 Outer membrane protein beta-barrel domain-containing protein [Pontibacter ummariensis]
MKKLLFAFAFVLLTFTAAQAQSGLGIRGGANLSNLEGDLRDESLYENKWGFHAGLTYNIAIVEDFFSVQPELLYSSKGFKNADEEYTLPNQVGTVYRREGKMNYNYIDLPILAKITAGPIYFEAGPQASYLLSVNDETRVYANDNLLTTSRTEIDKDNLKSFELGYAAGVGFTTGERFNIGVRYNGSFNDFVDDTPDNYFNEEDIRNARNSVFMLTAAVYFTR